MNNCNLTFNFNITNQTEYISFAFRKKTFFSRNYTIGNSSVDVADLIKSFSDINNNQSVTKTINIYYPIKK